MGARIAVTAVEAAHALPPITRVVVGAIDVTIGTIASVHAMIVTIGVMITAMVVVEMIAIAAAASVMTVAQSHAIETTGVRRSSAMKETTTIAAQMAVHAMLRRSRTKEKSRTRSRQSRSLRI